MIGQIIFLSVLVLFLLTVIGIVKLFFTEDGKDILFCAPMTFKVIAVVGALFILYLALNILVLFMLYQLIFCMNTSITTLEILELILAGGCLVYLFYAFRKIFSVYKQKLVNTKIIRRS